MRFRTVVRCLCCRHHHTCKPTSVSTGFARNKWVALLVALVVVVVVVPAQAEACHAPQACLV